MMNKIQNTFLTKNNLHFSDDVIPHIVNYFKIRCEYENMLNYGMLKTGNFVRESKKRVEKSVQSRLDTIHKFLKTDIERSALEYEYQIYKAYIIVHKNIFKKCQICIFYYPQHLDSRYDKSLRCLWYGTENAICFKFKDINTIKDPKRYISRIVNKWEKNFKEYLEGK